MKSNSKNHIISTVLLGKGTYSITICPDDKHQFVNKEDRLQHFIDFVNEQFIHFPTVGIHYKLHIELSEPRTILQGQLGPRLHLHGTLTFKSNNSVRNYLLREAYRLSRWSIIEIDTIDNPNIWLKYCTKQAHIMKTPEITNYKKPTPLNKKPLP